MSKSGWRTAPVDPVFESLQSASKRTGFSVPTFRDLVATGELPAYRINDKPGSAIRVKIADVDALMKPFIPAEVYATIPSQVYAAEVDEVSKK